MKSLKILLDELYDDTRRNSGLFIKNDPVEFPRLYRRKEEIEIAGLIASSLAYGKAAQFKKSIARILENGPEGKLYDYILNFQPSDNEVSYRIYKSTDIAAFIYIIREVLREYGSIGELFLRLYRKNEGNIRAALADFTGTLLKTDMSCVYGSDTKTMGLRHLLPNPANGSPCKKLNMFLRWMIRPDDTIDFGLWDIPPNRLIIPVDTHISFIARLLGLTDKKTDRWGTAEEITQSLKKLDPEDPVKYDFALSHIGISGNCRHKQSEACLACFIRDYCHPL